MSPETPAGDAIAKLPKEIQDRILDKRPFSAGDVFWDVKALADAANQPTTREMRQLYLKFVTEEYKELFDAVEDLDEVETLDALFDLIWVTAGALRCMVDNPHEAWIHGAISNFRKIDPVTGAVIKNEAGKVQKPADWVKPDFKQFLKKEYLDK